METVELNNLSIEDLKADFDNRSKNRTNFIGRYIVGGRKILCNYRYTYGKGGYIKTKRLFMRWVDDFADPKNLYMDWLEQEDGTIKATRHPVKVRN